MIERQRTLRWLVLLVALGFLVPMVLGVGQFSLGLVGKAKAAQTAQAPEILKVGFVQSIDSLNPFRGITDSAYVFYGLVYDYFYAVDADQNSVPNLADRYEIRGQGADYGKTWRYFLNKTAKWHDGSDFNADDVVETVQKNIAVSGQLWAYWPYLKNVESVVKVDADTVDLNFYSPIVFGHSLMFPILKKSQIQGISPVNLQNAWENPDPIGTGLFMAKPGTYQDWQAGGAIKLARNPNYHLPEINPQNALMDEIWLIVYGDEQTMATALVNNDIQVGTFSAGTLQGLKGKPNIATAEWLKATQYWIEVGINVDPQARKPTEPRLDLEVRRAMGLATNKQFILDQYYGGKGVIGNTLVSPITPKWHYEPTAEEKAYMEWTSATTTEALAKANATLNAAGYTNWNGQPTTARVGTAAANYSNKPLSFRMIWRTEFPEEGLVAQFLKAQWAKIGIQLTVEGVTEDVLESEIYGEKTDLYIWYWSGDPDPNYLLFIETTYAAYGGWNDNYYSDPAYDAAYDATMGEFNEAQRIQKVFDAQRIHYLSGSYIIFVYPYGEWAWNTKSWGGWIDPVVHPGASIEAFWTADPLWRSVYPLLTGAPTLDPLSDLTAEVNVPRSVTVRATDPEAGLLDYLFKWGDSTADTTVLDQPSGNSVTVSHTYTVTGTYTYTVNVTDPEGKYDVKSKSVVVTPAANLPPTIRTLTANKTLPITVKVGEPILFTANASDPEGDLLTYTWRWGDGSPPNANASVVPNLFVRQTHGYSAAGVFTVNLTVTDGLPGPVHSPYQTLPGDVTVLANQPPVVQPLTDISLTQNELHTFTVVATDPEGDPLNYTWNFGDGSPVAYGSTVQHAYAATGDFVFYVDVTDIDLGPPLDLNSGQTVTVSAAASVFPPGANLGPRNVTLTVAPGVSVPNGTQLSFTGDADDPELDPLNYTFEYGDGATAGPLLRASGVSVSVAHLYAGPGTYLVNMTVADPTPLVAGHSVRRQVAITVVANQPPLLTPPTPKEVFQGEAAPFTALAVDPDGDTLTYHWNFGDGTGWFTTSTGGITHTYTVAAGTYTYTVAVSDTADHNVSGTSTVTVRVRLDPEPIQVIIQLIPNRVEFNKSDVITFWTPAYDVPGTYNAVPNASLVILWDFGDGMTGSGRQVTHAYEKAGSYTVKLNVTDASSSVRSQTTINIVTKGGIGISALILGSVLAVVVVAAIVGWLLLRRKRGPEEGGAPPAGKEEAF